MRFLDACRREPTDATPIWMMRQAGRSLPEYRDLRKRYGFMEMVENPQLMAEITMLPLRHLEVDAAVMFADIMLPLGALGVSFEIVEAVGPVVENPVRSMEQVEAMTARGVRGAVPAVFEAIKIVRGELDPQVPLIGFSGAPFTLASYLVEGRPTKDFSKTKGMMFEDPRTWHSLMGRLTGLAIAYLSEQIAAGVDAVQLFDSWMGALAPQDYEEFAQPYSRRIFEEVGGVPRIHFGTGTPALLEAMAVPGADVIGIDWRTPLDQAWERVGYDRGVQGNLEPAVLLGPPELVRARAGDVLDRAGGRPGHIFNLGHGVLPDTPLDNLKLLVDFVHGWRAA